MTNLVDYAQLEFGLSDRLAKALSVSKTSSTEMAAALDVTPTTISNYTSGRTRPRKPIVQMWAMKTGVPYAWLETGALPDGGEPEKLPSDYKSAPSHPVTPLFSSEAERYIKAIA